MYESEVQCALDVAWVKELEGYKIVSKCVYPGSSRASQKFSELCGDVISGSFDLVVKDNKTGFLTGIEVKRELNSKSFHQALGQCISYLDKKRPEIKNASIFCDYTSPTYKRTCQDTLTNLCPEYFISIEELAPTIKNILQSSTFFQVLDTMSIKGTKDVHTRANVYRRGRDKVYQDSQTKWIYQGI